METYESASNTLRVVSFEQAAKRLVLKLQNGLRVLNRSQRFGNPVLSRRQINN